MAPDRVISHSDPEMRHGRKSASRRFDGHKLDVITDEDTELVLGVDVRAGNAADGEGAAPLLADVQGIDGIEVETLLGDMAYSDGDVREAGRGSGGRDGGQGPAGHQRRPVPQDRLRHRHGRRDRSPAPPATPPATPGQAKDHKGRPAIAVPSSTAATCPACPLRDSAPPPKAAAASSSGVHHDRIEAARAAQNDPQTKALLRRRSKVERKIDHLQDLGMRKARYRGRRKTLLQALLAATVANFKRLVVLDAFQEASLAVA